jgi:lysophospholipase L1-like esterase
MPEAEGPRSGLENPGAVRPLRLLVVGDSSAAGVGTDTQERALAQPLARALARTLARPVAWQLVARSGICAEEAARLVRESPPMPADVVVTAVGMNDVTGQRAHRFVRDVAELWSAASELTGARYGVFAGLPPLHALPAAPQPLRWYLGRYAMALDAALQAWVAPQAHLGYCSLQWASRPEWIAADGFHPGPAGYARWSALMADKVAEVVRRA